MRQLVFILLTLFAAASIEASTAPTTFPNPVTQKAGPSGPAAELSIADAITLGVVEGVTEYLPISSTGHLIIVSRLLGLESERPLVDRDGHPLWYKKPSPKHPAGEPLTLKLAADTYAVVIQFGAIAAVALIYWSQLVAMFQGLRGRDPAGMRLLINVLIAFVPAATLGFLLHGWINDVLFSIKAVIVAQLVGAGLMLFAESWRRRRAVLVKHVPEPDELTYRQAAGVGMLQCLALWPGMSRSMTTIVGGYFAGLDPRRAAEFSFLLGLATLTAATVFKSYRSGSAMIQVFGWSHVLLGAVVAAVTAAVSVRFLVGWLTRHGLAVFAYYRIGTALVLTALLAGGFLQG
ncbi:MAG: undecaprenyl-diphosphate phosphatase [Opitutaceae bacterium]